MIMSFSRNGDLNTDVESSMLVEKNVHSFIWFRVN